MNPNLFQSPFSPDYGTPPGSTLREVLERLGLSQSELAERTGRPKKTINEIVQGKAAITAETALQLERVLNIPASFWNNLERSYRAAQARQDERAELAPYVKWLDTLPVKEIVKRGWIRHHKDQIEQIREVLTFFGVALPNAWDEVWAEARKVTALRQGQSRQVDFGTVAVWLRKGEIEGRKCSCDPYVEDKFRDALAYLRSLTTLDPRKFCSEIVERCAASGVAVVFVPELPRLRIFGAARWLSSDRALIQLSLYYKREDQLWFSFFHEAAHILLHGRRDIFVDLDTSDADKQEVEANRFASDHLIPTGPYAQFVARRNWSVSAVQHFAKQVGISPGIVVGRLQHDKHIEFNQLTRLRRPIDWSVVAEAKAAAGSTASSVLPSR
jgi:HTH-type transcriptional regulator/antitoxin HigA